METDISRGVPVVVAFTPNYFIPVATCLYSLFVSSGQADCYHIICLLSEELPEGMKSKIQQIGKGRSTYSFINLEGKMNDIYVDSKFTVATLYRLLIPDLLLDYDKILYLDCDVIVRNNLAELYRQTNLGNHYLAGVFEAPMDFQMPHIRAIGCTPATYINAGFLIMNLALLRADNMVGKFMETIRRELDFFDQDTLNICCHGRIMGLPPRYNSIRTFFLPQYKSSFLQQYTVQDWEDVQLHGTVHYTGAKPWNHFTVEFRLWWQYYDRLPGEVKSEWKINRQIYALYKFYSTVPGAALINGIRLLCRIYK